jgi:hypothetical protein
MDIEVLPDVPRNACVTRTRPDGGRQEGFYV